MNYIDYFEIKIDNIMNNIISSTKNYEQNKIFIVMLQAIMIDIIFLIMLMVLVLFFCIMLMIILITPMITI